jgi:hypothetical protein
LSVSGRKQAEGFLVTDIYVLFCALFSLSPCLAIMDQLPGELIDHLCTYLSKPSLKSFRRTCKAFAGIGENYLFRDFEFRLFPSHHRLYQLEQLAAHSTIAPRLACLAYESGVQLESADYRYWQANIYHSINREWALGLGSRGSSSDQYEPFHTALQARFTPDMPGRYELYRWHLDQAATMMAEPRVRNTLMRIMNALAVGTGNLKLKIIMAEPNISLEELEAFDVTKYACDLPRDPDPRRRVLNRRQNCLRHFISFLEAAQLSDFRTTDFAAVNMPKQLLTLDSIHGSDILDETFRGLNQVDIKISELPHSDLLARGGMHEVYFGGRNLAARRLARILNHPANMDTLRLEFPEGNEAEYSFDIFDRTNIDRFPKLWLPHLKQLSLCRFRCTWEDLKALLEGAKKAKVLSLCHCRLETGSMLDLLAFLPSMGLHNVNLEGRWYVDEDEGEWHSHSEADFTDCFAATDYEGPYVTNGMKSKIEKYCLEGGECPLPQWTTEGKESQIWEMKGDTSWHYLPGLRRAQVY